jgi:hypothetical protein
MQRIGAECGLYRAITVPSPANGERATVASWPRVVTQMLQP